MYINNPLGDLGKTPKWIKNIDRNVRDAGKYVDKSVRRVAEDVSDQHKRNMTKVTQAHRGTLKTLNLDDKTPKWLKAPERQVKRTARQALPAATALVGYIYGGPIGAGGGAIQGKYRGSGKGAPGSVEREKYQDRIARTQHYTRVGTGAALAVAGGVAAYGAYGAGAGGAAGGAGAGGGTGAAATAGKVGAALSTAASMGDKITDMLDPFNPDANANAPSGAEQSTASTPKPPANQIPWLPLALAAGFFLL